MSASHLCDLKEKRAAQEGTRDAGSSRFLGSECCSGPKDVRRGIIYGVKILKRNLLLCVDETKNGSRLIFKVY